jgi:hypothetical protein
MASLNATILSSTGVSLNVCKTESSTFLTAVMFNLERSFFTELSTYLKLSEPEPLPENIDSAGNAKLRYVSGYVLAKLKYNLSKKIRNCLYVKGKEVDLSNYQCEMNILISLCSSYDELIASTQYKNHRTLLCHPKFQKYHHYSFLFDIGV